jgi:polysaccharide pyruvyl transferase WcaK-like protein
MSHRRRALPSEEARIGLFGLFGCGNVGNDGTLDAMLQRLRVEHSRHELVIICREPARVEAAMGVAAVSMLSYRDRVGRSKLRSLTPRLLSKFIDPLWIFLVVRRLEVVVVPGMGVFEQQIRVRPWGLPYALFLLAMSCKLSGTKLAFVSVGAEPIDNPITRAFVVRAAKTAEFCSFRDEFSRRSMADMGGLASDATVCPDLVLGLPYEAGPVADNGAVCIGVMAYYGPTDDKKRYAEAHEDYVSKLRVFVLQVADAGHQVRLLTGDIADEKVAARIREYVLVGRPAMAPERVVVVPATTLAETMAAIVGCHAVVATRYHNVLCALLLRRPTISLGYGGKHDDLMSVMGLPEMSDHVSSFDVTWLSNRFKHLSARGPRIVDDLARRTEVARGAVADQHDHLERSVFGRIEVPERVLQTT